MEDSRSLGQDPWHITVLLEVAIADLLDISRENRQRRQTDEIFHILSHLRYVLDAIAWQIPAPDPAARSRTADGLAKTPFAKGFLSDAEPKTSQTPPDAN